LLETGYFGIKFCDYLFGSHTGSLSATTQRGSPTRVECPSCFAERITFDTSRREQVSVPLANLRNHARPAWSKADSASHNFTEAFLSDITNVVIVVYQKDAQRINAVMSIPLGQMHTAYPL
jgi:hypothetical protein